MLEKLTTLSGWASLTTDDWTALGAIAGIVAATIAAVALVPAGLPTYMQYRDRKMLQRSFGADSFDDNQLRRALDNYIPPLCTNVDPAGEEDLRQVVPFQNPLFAIVDSLLRKERAEKHILLLADSGMGKTSFLLNYFARNHRLRESNQLRIAIIPLGRPDVLKRIEKISEKRSTVLFLDAFDEDTKAIEDHRTRLSELMDACSDFRRVLVTCRSQFFQSDEEIPRETGIAIVAPRKAGESRQYKFYKIYLAPFTDEMVRRYLRARFPLTQWRHRHKAFALVESIPELSLRPMLLSVVPDLVVNQTGARNISDVYAFMVESWLQRESSWITISVLRAISEKVAVNVYLLREKRGYERIPRAELDALLDRQAPDLENWRLTTRSLLNRDSLGKLKFAHRSIMEYLFVRAFLKGEPLCALVEWTDLMKEFFVTSLSSEPALINSMPLVTAEELRVTGFFPIGSIDRSPRRLGKRDAIRHESAPPASGVAWGLWRSVLELRGAQCGWMRTETNVSGVRVIDDYASGTAWMIVVEPAAETIESIQLTDPITAAQNQKELNRQYFGGRGDWQLPTLAQFDYLMTAMEGEKLLVWDMLYWASDISVDGNSLAVSIGESAISREDIVLLAKRELGLTAALRETESLFVYELRLARPKSIDKYPIGACIWTATKDVGRVARDAGPATLEEAWTTYLGTVLNVGNESSRREGKR